MNNKEIFGDDALFETFFGCESMQKSRCNVIGSKQKSRLVPTNRKKNSVKANVQRFWQKEKRKAVLDAPVTSDSAWSLHFQENKTGSKNAKCNNASPHYFSHPSKITGTSSSNSARAPHVRGTKRKVRDNAEETGPNKIVGKSELHVKKRTKHNEKYGDKIAPFTVEFRNEDLFRRYGQRISKVLKGICAEKDFPFFRKYDPIKLEIKGNCLVDVEKEHEEREEAEARQISYDIPKMPNDENDQREQDTIRCFNCRGEHHLSKCPSRRDFEVIKRNKLEFYSSKYGNQRIPRYHDEDTNNDTGSNLKVTPGRISQELHSAMGLSSDELPLFIYNMRVLGYPPGWLAEAVVEPSGIAIIDNCNEDQPVASRSVRYDFSKIHEYPGFNVYAPPGTRDTAYALRRPPMMAHHLKSNWKRDTNDVVYKPPNRLKAPLVDKTARRSDTREFEEVPTYKRICDENPPSRPIKRERSTSPSLNEGKKLSDGGTAIPHRRSKQTQAKIPSMDKFSKNVTDYIPFENLPGHTGKYKQMDKVLKRIRKKLCSSS